MQSFLLSVGEMFVPILKDSKFKESGRLTPEEFVAAGDYLVFKCPTWSWSSGEESKKKSYLPSDKQFLITRNVPAIPPETLSKLEEEEEGQESTTTDSIFDDFQNVNIGGNSNLPEINELTDHFNELKSSSDPLELDNIPDIETFNEENIIITDDPLLNLNLTNSEKNSNFLTTQTYDLYITYDKYYQTPRMWISGYDQNGSQLLPETILDFVSQDHAHKTVTVESFPHLSTNFASVHPCKHAAVMKKIIDHYSEGEKVIRVDQYLVLFLKFMSSIMPSVDYDHTMSME